MVFEHKIDMVFETSYSLHQILMKGHQPEALTISSMLSYLLFSAFSIVIANYLGYMWRLWFINGGIDYKMKGFRLVLS